MELSESRAGPRETTVATAEREDREQCGTCAGENNCGGPATLYLRLTGQGEHAPEETDDDTERTSDTAHTPDDDDCQIREVSLHEVSADRMGAIVDAELWDRVRRR